MPLLRRTAVRLLAGILVLAALGGGLWWWSSNGPLNETEKRLVGVWEVQGNKKYPIALILLPDRREAFIQSFGDRWENPSNRMGGWTATPKAIRFRSPPPDPPGMSPEKWLNQLVARVANSFADEYELTEVTEDQFRYTYQGHESVFIRSTNPVLNRLFKHLESRESP